MKFYRSRSINKQVKKNHQLLVSYLPDSLKNAIVSAWKNRYEELYEPESDEDILLEEALNKILASFESKNQALTQLRYVWMGLILAITVEPTIKYCQPESTIPEKTIDQLTKGLLKTLAEMISSKKRFNGTYKHSDALISVNINNLFSENNLSSLQVLSEALDVYQNALKILEPNHSLPALLEILDDCLEGYAIFPGSEGRRELFDWWLSDVVPFCWYLLPPASIYRVKELPHARHNDQTSVSSQLEEISNLIWFGISKAIQQSYDSKSKNKSDSHQNIFLDFNEEINKQVEYKQLELGTDTNYRNAKVVNSICKGGFRK